MAGELAAVADADGMAALVALAAADGCSDWLSPGSAEAGAVDAVLVAPPEQAPIEPTARRSNVTSTRTPDRATIATSSRRCPDAATVAITSPFGS